MTCYSLIYFFFLIVSIQVYHCLPHTGREGLWLINRIKISTSYCFPSHAPSLHLPATIFSYSLLFRTALLIINSHTHTRTSLAAGIWPRGTILQHTVESLLSWCLKAPESATSTSTSSLPSSFCTCCFQNRHKESKHPPL